MRLIKYFVFDGRSPYVHSNLNVTTSYPICHVVCRIPKSTLLTLKQFSHELDFNSFSGLTVFAFVEIRRLQLGRSALKDSAEMSKFQCARKPSS